MVSPQEGPSQIVLGNPLCEFRRYLLVGLTQPRGGTGTRQLGPLWPPPRRKATPRLHLRPPAGPLSPPCFSSGSPTSQEQAMCEPSSPQAMAARTRQCPHQASDPRALGGAPREMRRMGQLRPVLARIRSISPKYGLESTRRGPASSKGGRTFVNMKTMGRTRWNFGTIHLPELAGP